MREPTPRSILYAYWRAALVVLAKYDMVKGIPPSEFKTTGLRIEEDSPQCGFYRRKLVRDGPWVPVVIWMEQEIDEAGELVQPEVLRCEVNGLREDPLRQWTYCCCNPITEAQFQYMRDLAAYARVHAPDEPEAHPTQPINLTTAPLPF